MAAGDDGVPTDLTASWVGMPTPNSLRDRVRSWVTVEEEVPSPASMPEPEPEPQQEAAAAAAAAEEEEEEEEEEPSEEEEEEAATSTLVMSTRHAEDELLAFEEWFSVECPGELVQH